LFRWFALCAAILLPAGSAEANGADDLRACYQANDNGDYDKAIALCTRAVESGDLSKSDQANALNDRGNAYNSQGDFDQAIASYDQAIKLAPEYAEAYFDRATAYEGKEDYARAIEDYGREIALLPSDGNAFFSRGQDFALEGKYKDAIRDYDQAGKVDPKYGDVAAWAKGQALFNLGRFPEASAEFERYLNMKPDYAYGALWLYLAQAHAKQDGGPSLADRSQQIDLGQWPGPLVQLYLGQLPVEGALAAAKQGDPSYRDQHACEAAFYIGEFNLVSGRAKGCTA
jgi:lipoprotein NlpI